MTKNVSYIPPVLAYCKCTARLVACFCVYLRYCGESQSSGFLFVKLQGCIELLCHGHYSADKMPAEQRYYGDNLSNIISEHTIAINPH